MLNDSLDIYDIKKKVFLAVSDNCNLMNNAFTFSGILRLPCSCHLLNLFLKAFIKPSEKTILEISSAARSLRSSVCYAALKDDFDELKIANYTEIRWISLYQTFKSLLNSRQSINTFYIAEDESIKFKLTSIHWTFIESMIPILKTYKSVIKILEGDDFGSISLVLISFNKIKTEIENLPSCQFHDNIQSFKNEYDEKMKLYKQQMHPLYDAAAILNPFINNTNVNLKEGIDYIESKMKSIGWSPGKIKVSTNKTVNFLNSISNESLETEISPVRQFLNMGTIDPDQNENETLGDVLFRYWKRKLDSNVDTFLSKVALGILNQFCTSCSCERLFSKASQVLTRERLRLMPDVAESQVIIMANRELAEKYCNI